MNKKELVEAVIKAERAAWKPQSKTSIRPNWEAVRRVYSGLTKTELQEKMNALKTVQ